MKRKEPVCVRACACVLIQEWLCLDRVIHDDCSSVRTFTPLSHPFVVHKYKKYRFIRDPA